MPGKRHYGSSKARPRYKWCGFGELRTLETAAATGTGEVTVVCPRLVAEDAQGDVTIEAVYIHMAIQKTATNSGPAAAGYMLAVQKADNTSGDPNEVLNPLALTSADAGAQLGSRDLLSTGLMPIPATISDGSSGANEVSGEVLIHEVQFKARRRLFRLTHGVFLHMVADVTNIVTVFVSGRILLRYS